MDDVLGPGVARCSAVLVVPGKSGLRWDSMASKLVTDREKSTNAVIAAARTHGAVAASAIAQALAGVVDKGEKQPDVALLLELCTRVLDRSIGQVVTADKANEAELADDAEPRERRDERAATLNADIVELKEIATGLLGRAVLQPLRLQGTTPRDPLALMRYAEGVAGALRTVELPKSRVRGARFHAKEWAERLEETIEGLSEALRDVSREAREAEGTLVAKNRALAEHDRIFGDVATLVSALLRMGGEVELAARVRPSARRPGQTVEAAEGGEEAPPEPGAGGASGG
jgi:hypothetical protein